MVDERKVSLMTKLSIYEKHEKHRSLVLSRYFKSDYVRFNVLKTWIATTVAYCAVVGAYVMMSFDDILAELNTLDYFDVMYKFLGYYVVCCAVMFMFSSLVYKFRYSKAKPGLIRYNSNLKDLIELQGGPMRRGRMVRNSALNTEIPTDKQEANNSVSKGKTRVNRSEIVKRRMEEEEQIKNQQIIENVKQRNARIAARNEAELARQHEIQQEKQRIQQRRKQMEQQQLEQLRNQRMNNNRENHTYNGNDADNRKGNR